MNKIELDRELLSLLPPWYRRIQDYQQICQTEQEQFDLLAEEITSVAQNFFFQSMDVSAVSQWEKVLGIVPNPVSESISFRRSRLLNRISTRPPYTMEFLRQRLDVLIGPGAWTARMDYPNYTLYVESSAENQQYAAEVAVTINRIKPAHIVYINTPLLSAGLLLSEQIDLSQRIYNYRLGGWGLGVAPFASETPQGVIKMPETKSIQQKLLEGVAGFVSGDIASARVNGTVTIADLEKRGDGSRLTVTYSVAQDQAAEITQVELLDTDGNVLTASTVYIPVTGSTVLKHTIPVREGVIANGG